MSSFSGSAFEKKLGELSNSQQSVQTLSLWLIHHRKHAKSAVQIWYKELVKAKPSRKLTFLYLSNDVIQNGKRKGPEFSKEFMAVLPSAFVHCSKECPGDVRKQLERIITIWKERSVYEGAFVEKLKKSIKDREQPKRESSPPPLKKIKSEELTISPVDSPAVVADEVEVAVKPAMPLRPPSPTDPEELIRVLQELENSASQDAVVREKIANLPAEVQDVSVLDKIQDKQTAERLVRIVDEACILLAEYNGRLAAELEDRAMVSKMLNDFIAEQKYKIVEGEKRLEEHKGKLQKVTLVRKELQSHLANLPDLSKLPDVTGGLAPLPSAGDLFAASSSRGAS